MITDHTLVRKLIAVATVAVMLIISSRAIFATRVRPGALAVLGQVEVNGDKMISGSTFFSDSVIVTREESEATITLGASGRISLFANSKMRLSITSIGLNAWLDVGAARISVPPGVSFNLVIPDGVVLVDGSHATSFTVVSRNGRSEVVATTGAIELISDGACKLITTGDDVVAGEPQSQLRGLHGKALAGLLVAIGGAVAAAIWIATHDSGPHANDMTFGGTVIVPSG